MKAGPLGTWVQGKPEGGGRTAGELRAAGCGADGREPEPAGIARLPRQSPRPWQVPRRPASVVSVKQEDNSNSSPLLPPLSLRIPTVSCPACRRSNRQKEQPPREREWGAVPSCSGQTLRKQPPCFSTHSILHFWKICPWIRSVPQAGHAALGSLGVRSQPRSQAPALDPLPGRRDCSQTAPELSEALTRVILPRSLAHHTHLSQSRGEGRGQSRGAPPAPIKPANCTGHSWPPPESSRLRPGLWSLAIPCSPSWMLPSL